MKNKYDFDLFSFGDPCQGKQSSFNRFSADFCGIYGYPKDKAWGRAIQACVDFIRADPDYEIEIFFAVLKMGLLRWGKENLGVPIGRRGLWNVTDNLFVQSGQTSYYVI